MDANIPNALSCRINSPCVAGTDDLLNLFIKTKRKKWTTLMKIVFAIIFSNLCFIVLLRVHLLHCLP